jgi:hypothetical protein
MDDTGGFGSQCLCMSASGLKQKLKDDPSGVCEARPALATFGSRVQLLPILPLLASLWLYLAVGYKLRLMLRL